ncbi:MAG: LytR/AlgR family response regulator transcription factor [Dyadobacter fermentans]
MNILIVEDEKLAVRKLTKLLQETDTEFEITGTTPSIAATVEWIADNRLKGNAEPDIIFLDIELADGQSFEIFNRIEIRSVVIFTTSYDEYALQAFKVNSIDYLLKPVQLEDLERSIKKYHDLKSGIEKKETSETVNLEKILRALQLKVPEPEYRKRFLVKQGQRLLSVETSEIGYFHIDESVCLFRNQQGQKFVVEYTVDELEKCLDPKQFFRINRGIILTHSCVAQIQPYFNNRLSLTLKPSYEKEAIVSRDRVNDFKKWMGK